MTLDFFSNLVDWLQRLLRDADLSVPTFEQLRSQDKRSEELLFIYLSEDNAYLLDILKHEKADGSVVTWTNTDLIQIIHDNRPHLIKPFIYKTNSTTPILSTEQRKALRKNAGNTHVVLHDGTEYMLIGFGFTSSKHSTSAVFQSDHLLFKVRNLQATVKENYQGIKQALVEHTTELIIKLNIDDNFQPFVV